ncbi:MAG: ATP-binding cassette domain-containing protein [bacterium]
MRKKNNLRCLLSLIGRGTKLKCVGVVLLAMVGSVLATLWPVQLGRLYTDISGGEIDSIHRGLAAVAIFGIVYLAAECVTIVRRVLLDCIIATHEAELRESSVERLLKMPVAFYSGCLSGERTAQLNQGVAGLSQLIKILCNDVFATVLTATCTLIQMTLNAPSLMVGIMLMYLISTIFISAMQIRSQNGIREEIIRQKNALDGNICQSIGNLELIRGMNAGAYETKRLHPAIFRIGAVERRHHRSMGAFDCAKQACKIAFQVVIILASIWMIAAGRMASGAVITVCLLFQQLIKPIDEVYRFMDETASSIVKAKVLADVSAQGEDLVFSIPDAPTAPQDGDIAFHNVVIANPERSKPLAQYDALRIPGGRIVGLKGASGCGKTTMIRSLTRYFPVLSGQITVFGRDLDTYSQKELAEQLFYVPQQSFFFAGSIRENLEYGMSQPVAEGALLDALDRACVLDTLRDRLRETSPDAASVLDYRVGEGGSGLSGGERQRISIARAFLRNPKVYIFDESTANLDTVTAEKVLTNVEARARANGAGVVYISHDPTVMKRCDEVILVKNLIATAPEPQAA